jgi:NAD(P)-dependent dehydrogenase (short-subunit alcohol dehydrogenase family)
VNPGSTQVAIVTGCGRSNGIGAGVVRRLAAAGMAVAATDLLPGRADGAGSADELDALVAEIRDAGGEAVACRGDVSSESDCARVVDEVLHRLGGVTVLVNNAGAPHGPDRAFVADVPLDAWQRQLDVNLTGQFLMIRAVVPHLVERRYGRIVNISSGAALGGIKERAAYSASKAGILGLTRSVAADLARYGITVNAICPGAIATARAVSTATREQASVSVEEAFSQRAAATPVGRMGMPADIAAVVAFLASPESDFITGQVLSVDGGAGTARS